MIRNAKFFQFSDQAAPITSRPMVGANYAAKNLEEWLEKAFFDPTGYTDNSIASLGLNTGTGDLTITMNDTSSTTIVGNLDGRYQISATILNNLVTLGEPTTDGQFIVATGAGAFAYESGATVRASLGLGDMALQNANSVAITGGAIAGITDLAIADGGTGASTAADARTNLGLGSLALANSIDNGNWSGTALSPVNGGTGLTTYTTGDIIYASAANTLAALPVGTNGHVLTLSGGLPTWVASGASLSVGLSGQIPYTNGVPDDFSYDSGFNYDGTQLILNQLLVGGVLYPIADGTAGQGLVTDGAGVLSFATITPVTFGLQGELPFTNSGLNDYDYTSNLSYDGTNLLVNREDGSATGVLTSAVFSRSSTITATDGIGVSIDLGVTNDVGVQKHLLIEHILADVSSPIERSLFRIRGYGIGGLKDYLVINANLAYGTYGSNSTALGIQSTASGTNSTAVGQGSNATALFSTAIGSSAIANADYALAFGTSSQVGELYGIGIGFSASVSISGDNGIAIGRSSSVTGTNGIAIGYDAGVGVSTGGIALGYNSSSQAQGAIIMGYHTSTQINSISDSFKLMWDGVTGFHVGLTIGTAITSNVDPDTNLTAAVNGSIAYDSTDHEIRARINGTWTAISTGGTLSNITDDTGNSLLIGNTGTAGDVTFTAQGSDTDVDIIFSTKGAGNLTADLNTSGWLQITENGTIGLKLRSSSTSGIIALNTSDTTDNAALTMSGGGGNGGETRGASIVLQGNENALPGRVAIVAGNVSGGDIRMTTQGSTRWILDYNGDITYGDGTDFIFNTTTGTKIGTSTSQKIAFYNSTPIIQPSSTGEINGFTAGAGTGVNDDSTFTGNVGSTAYRISDIVKHLKNLGLIAT